LKYRRWAFPALFIAVFAIADFEDELVGNGCYWSISDRLSHAEEQQCPIFI
jgi:hypothetical protein